MECEWDELTTRELNWIMSRYGLQAVFLWYHSICYNYIREINQVNRMQHSSWEIKENQEKIRILTYISVGKWTRNKENQIDKRYLAEKPTRGFDLLSNTRRWAFTFSWDGRAKLELQSQHCSRAWHLQSAGLREEVSLLYPSYPDRLIFEWSHQRRLHAPPPIPAYRQAWIP